MKIPSISPVARLSLGLTGLLLVLLTLLDITNVIPDRQKITYETRQRIGENLGMQVAFTLGRGDLSELGNLLRAVQSHKTDIQSVALLRQDGTLVTQVGEHSLHWQPRVNGQSDAENILVPLFSEKQPWGRLELSFRSSASGRIDAWLKDQLLTVLLLSSVAGFIVFYLYLRRALSYLDPTRVVPERVQRAFDSLREVIIILDQAGRIMLTNTAFNTLYPNSQKDLVGCNISEQQWLLDGLGTDSAGHPWTQAITEGKEIKGVLLRVTPPDGEMLHIVLNVSPVRGPNGALRGCLICMDNVSELHHVNEKLVHLVSEIKEARTEVEKQNKELQLLVSRDPLTGCYNRRYLFEKMEELYVTAQSENEGFCCIMADIDLFKSFNDTYGHSVGDEVIRAVVRCLQSGLRPNDMLFRYGGEEFCMLLPSVSLPLAQMVAERLRGLVEQHAAKSVRTIPDRDRRITSSFGVAEFNRSMLDSAELVGRADEALYKSKHNGRNCVTVWQMESSVAA